MVNRTENEDLGANFEPKQDFSKLSKSEKNAEFERQVAQLEKERSDELKRLKNRDQNIDSDSKNDYVTMYEQQYQREKVLQDVFLEESKQEVSKLDIKKPALFRNKKLHSNPEKPSTFQEEYSNMAPDSSQSFADLKKQYRVPEGQFSQHMENEAFNMMFHALKERQLKFYAFLNKEFNILNYKSARCALHCYDDISTSVFDAAQCVQVCRQGVTSCKDFTKQIQDQADSEVKSCHEEASGTKVMSDPIMHWISWYEKLILKFDDMETEILSEFSNFI